MAFRIFFCYADKDKELFKRLRDHLASFIRSGVIEAWSHQDISAGIEWEPEKIKQLNQAHIILLLISASFLASDHCYGQEMKRALERHDMGETRVIPILLRPVYSLHEPFRKLQSLPSNGKPVIKWPIKDDAFVDIAEGIATVIRELDRRKDVKKTQLTTSLVRELAQSIPLVVGSSIISVGEDVSAEIINRMVEPLSVMIQRMGRCARATNLP
jgi:hypothetical protein